MANPATVQFPVSLIINVDILPTPTNLQVPNINTAALFTTDTPSWSGSQAFAIYTNANDVATDFGSGSNTFKIATAFFSQNPNPIGTDGYLVICNLIMADSGIYENAIKRITDLVYFFGVLIDTDAHSIITSTQFANLAAYMQTTQKMLFIASGTTADYQSPSGIFFAVQQAGQTNTRCLYYTDGVAIDTPAFAAAYAGRALTTFFDGSNTTETMNLKQLIGFTPDQTLTSTTLVEVQTAGVDVYISIGGVPSLYTSGENAFFDEIYNQYWFAFALQVAGFNYLAGTNGKIPQTEVGMEGLKNAYRQICQQGINNGFIAPGSWTSGTTFGPNGALVRNIADQGFYVFSQPITQQNPSDRAARKAPLVQIAVKAAGAIQHSDIVVNVNQ